MGGSYVSTEKLFFLHFFLFFFLFLGSIDVNEPASQAGNDADCLHCFR